MNKIGRILLKIFIIIFFIIIALIAIFVYITKIRITDVAEFVNEDNKYKIILVTKPIAKNIEICYNIGRYCKRAK